MLSSLLVTAFLMGLAGVPHCTAMCGTACAAVFPKGVSVWTLIGRAIGYACLGVVAATAAGQLARWGQQVAMIKPLWMMAQFAMVLLGCFMLWRGFVPHRIDQAGKGLYGRLRQFWHVRSPQWPRSVRQGWPFLAGLAWAFLPCGLLYAALMVAALASHPWQGGLVMLAFALPSAGGVWAAPALLRWLRAQGQQTQITAKEAPVPVVWMRAERGADAQFSGASAAVAPTCADDPFDGPAKSVPFWLDQRIAVRIAGLGLATMSAWGLWHQLWAQWLAWCA